MRDENVYVARLHWIIFVWPLMVLGIGIYVHETNWRLPELGYAIMGLAALWAIGTWLKYKFSSLTIQKHHVVLRVGILLRQTIDIPTKKIESTDVRQTILGSIFKYGTIVITGTGGTQQYISYISKPLTCRRHIETMVNSST